jgi:hypothetical protein
MAMEKKSEAGVYVSVYVPGLETVSVRKGYILEIGTPTSPLLVRVAVVVPPMVVVLPYYMIGFDGLSQAKMFRFNNRVLAESFAMLNHYNRQEEIYSVHLQPMLELEQITPPTAPIPNPVSSANAPSSSSSSGGSSGKKTTSSPAKATGNPRNYLLLKIRINSGGLWRQ